MSELQTALVFFTQLAQGQTFPYLDGAQAGGFVMFKTMSRALMDLMNKKPDQVETIKLFLLRKDKETF